MIRHIFEVSINGLNIPEKVSFGNISERYRNIEMSHSSNGSLLLTITKRKTNPINVSINEAKNEANELVDRLALLDNHHVTNLEYLGFKNKEDVLTKEKKDVTVKVSTLGLIINPTEFYNRDANKHLLNKKDNLGVLRTYRAVLGISDKLSQYLIFYGLLLVLKGESQKKVDTFIKKEIPDIQLVFGKNGNETIITKIRNMIAHPSNGLDMNQLNEYVNSYIDIIKNLVRNELKK